MTNFGDASYGARFTLMDANCVNLSGPVLTLETPSEITFENGDSKDFTSIVQVNRELIPVTTTGNVVFPSDGSDTNVRGELIFCLKSHSTENFGGTQIIEIEVLKIRFRILYEYDPFEFQNIIEEDITGGGDEIVNEDPPVDQNVTSNTLNLLVPLLPLAPLAIPKPRRKCTSVSKSRKSYHHHERCTSVSRSKKRKRRRKR